MRKRVIIVSAATAVVLAGIMWSTTVWYDKSASASNVKATRQWGGKERGTDRCFSGYGWSYNADTTTAVDQALAGARGMRRQTPKIVLAAYTHPHSPEQIIKAIRARVGPAAAIFGLSCGPGIVGPDGYHHSETGVIGVLLLKTDGTNVGVGGADLDEAASPEACAALALGRAKTGAGLSGPSDTPSMVFMCPTYDGFEENYVQAISGILGEGVPVLGGTAGSTDERGPKGCTAIANDKVVRKGLAVAVFRSGMQFGWAFRGGFERTGKSGVVTASTGRELLKIDGRPALDVYDEWTGGKIKETIRAGGNPRLVSALYPVCRTVGADGKSGNIFIHMWPKGGGSRDTSLICSANLLKGDTVHFSEGSWNILLNKIGLLPQQAKEEQPGMQAEAGFLICCEGLLLNIPESERDKIAQLLNQNLGEVPWLGAFTWGEQGNFRGVGNYHGNLLAGLALFPDLEPPSKK